MSTYYQDANTTILHGDCIETMRTMPDNSVDSIVTDPPYGLSNTTPEQVADTIMRWVNGDREYLPSGKGFMGKAWDGFVPPVAVWDEAMRVLKPGGHLLAFAGSRTHDLMTMGIRLAGFEIRDSVAWLYGSGFPKSHDVGKAIDKLAGAEREVIGHKGGRYALGFTEAARDHFKPYGGGAFTADPSTIGQITAPATPEAQQWDGWGTALKPAFEPIVMARKPLAEKTVARNVLAHGTGAINIDACRIAGEPVRIENYASTGPQGMMSHGHGGGSGHAGEERTARISTAGRWPANVILDEHTAELLDQQSGWQKDGFYVGRNRDATQTANAILNPRRKDVQDGGYGGSGGASRFFYCAKAGKSERPVVDGVAHATVKPLKLMRYLVRMVTPPGGTILEPFAGSGTTIEAAILEGFNSIGIERETEYLPLIQHRINRANGGKP